MRPNLVAFHAHQRVLAHPHNLLAQGGKTVQSIHIEGKIDRDDVRPVIARTGQPPETKTREELSAFLASHSRDQHFVTRSDSPREQQFILSATGPSSTGDHFHLAEASASVSPAVAFLSQAASI
jgi:hypothetical protein